MHTKMPIPSDLLGGNSKRMGGGGRKPSKYKREYEVELLAGLASGQGKRHHRKRTTKIVVWKAMLFLFIFIIFFRLLHVPHA